MKKRNRGFTVVEVVIAMAIIVIVTVAAVSLFVFAQNARKSLLATSNAQHFAEDARLAFRTADDETEFLSYLTFAREGTTLTDAGVASDGTHTYLYVNGTHGYTATLDVRYSTAERSTFSIRITRGEDHELLRLSYEKGDA